jgi:sigma-B regulation protein RsbU (phosphoserine phosphatase)
MKMVENTERSQADSGVMNATAEALIAAIEQSVGESRQMETVLERLLQALTQNGFQLSVDLVGIMQGLSARLDGATRDARLVINRVEQLDGLLRTFTLITSSLELDTVLNEVMDTVIRLTGAERAYLMLRDKATGELQIVVARNWDRESLANTDAVFSNSIVTQALQEGKAILTTNAATDNRFQNARSVVNNQLRSILCIPLIVGREPVGVLYADNRITQDVFRADSIPLLTAFGTQAAIAIENAQLYGKVKDDLSKALIELQTLQIQIDKGKLERQVSQITETDYFQKLSTSARSMRGRFLEMANEE